MTNYNYEEIATNIVKRHKKNFDDPDTVKKMAINSIMRWLWKPEEKKVESAVEKAMKKLQIDESKTSRKLDVLISHK